MACLLFCKVQPRSSSRRSRLSGFNFRFQVFGFVYKRVSGVYLHHLELFKKSFGCNLHLADVEVQVSPFRVFRVVAQGTGLRVCVCVCVLLHWVARISWAVIFILPISTLRVSFTCRSTVLTDWGVSLYLCGLQTSKSNFCKSIPFLLCSCGCVFQYRCEVVRLLADCCIFFFCHGQFAFFVCRAFFRCAKEEGSS